MAVASLVGNAMLSGGRRPLTRGLTARHISPSSGAHLTRTTKKPFALRRGEASPSAALRLHVAATSSLSLSSFVAAPRCSSRLAHVRAFRNAVVACASEPEDAVATEQVGGEDGVSSEGADSSAGAPPPPPDDSAPAPEEQAAPLGTSFADLGLSKSLCAALQGAGFKEPSQPQVSAAKYERNNSDPPNTPPTPPPRASASRPREDRRRASNRKKKKKKHTAKPRLEHDNSQK